MRIADIVYTMLFNKCPRCHNGQVFKDNNPYHLGKMFKLHENCSHCNLKYEREPSFFYGSLYVSYALTSGWFIVWFALYMTVLKIEPLTLAFGITGSLILLSPLTIRWSRMIWLNFFYKFDKKYKVENLKHLTYKVEKKEMVKA